VRVSPRLGQDDLTEGKEDTEHMAKKYTVILLDRELSEHEPQFHHVMADSPAAAIKTLFQAFYDQFDHPDEAERLSQREFDLYALQPIAVFSGHLTDVLPSAKATDKLIATMQAATQRKLARLAKKRPQIVNAKMKPPKRAAQKTA
jgi:hypothetical protein